MQQITLNEQKKIMIQMLKKFDEICRKNNIKYSLIGGTLIGAIRHGKIIPWDDDIDVVLDVNEYKKLLRIIENFEDLNYTFQSYEKNNTYFYPFIKMIDKRTIMRENGCKEIKNYGVYIDIFRYINLPKNKILRFWYIRKIKFIKILMGVRGLDIKSKKRNSIKRFIIWSVEKISIKKILEGYDKISNKYNEKETEYCIVNWPSYDNQKEVQKRENIKNYINIKFEDMEAMIFDGYDEILKTTFGDYMKLPPKEKRVSNHNTKVFWKDIN